MDQDTCFMFKMICDQIDSENSVGWMLDDGVVIVCGHSSVSYN